MDYLLFTYPNCPHCERLKNYMTETSLEWEEFNLVRKEGKMRIRDFLGDINRDDSGCIILPTLVALEEGDVSAVLNSHEELDDWLKSKG